jgi:ABC-type Fe3+-siderophore transport system, permease component
MAKIKNTVAIAVVLVVFMSAFSVAYVNGEGEAGATPAVLIDMGNGETYWADADTTKTTTMDVLKNAIESIGLEYEVTGPNFISIDGRESITIKTVNSKWNYYVWSVDRWITATLSITETYSGENIAMGFYPPNATPSETPEFRSSWVMIMGNAAQTGHQTTDMSSEKTAATVFEKNYGTNNYVNGSSLIVGDKLYFVAGGNSREDISPILYCYDRFTFEKIWEFEYTEGVGYETATGLIVNGHFYLPATNGTLYKVPLTGPGDNKEYVKELEIPMGGDHTLIGNTYASGPSTLSYDSGAIYFGTSTGYIYCVDLDLNVLWKTPIGGCVYYSAVTVVDNIVYSGALNGVLYVLDGKNGDILASETVYTYDKTVRVNGKNEIRTYGLVSVPVVLDDIIYMSFSDGQGMNTVYGGIAAYKYDKVGKTLTKVFLSDAMGVSCTYLLPTELGVYFTSAKVPLGRIDPSGNFETINGNLETVKAAMQLINGEILSVTEYRTGGFVYQMDLEGNVLGKFKQPASVANWGMSPAVVVDSYVYVGTDAGFFAVGGTFTTEPASSSSSPLLKYLLLAILIVFLAAFIAYCIYIKRTKNVPPISYIRGRISQMSGLSKEGSKTKRNKRRLGIVLLIGTILAFVMFLCCLSFGPSGTISLSEALSSLVSAIQKGGTDLTFNEIIVYESRLPRAIAALGVGMGLAIAGSLYQAIIRNPLVDPYIMGVSSGAGTLAVAGLVANFTFFGLLEGINYATPILAIVGGLVAFFLTMLIAEKAGGSNTNFVLAGVVVGLAFSSLMTIMLATAQSDKLHGALTWLYGSFANIGWDTVWLVFFPAVFMSLVPLIWAKELNLVLLGEDQAQQMGLNVRRFNRWMLIFASVLTAVCVAFVGIIGFVGLVVPHVCRMILGGDHRLVLPASIVLGGVLMLFADLLARMIMIPQELPVGAITTVIGVPLFAYLLIKKGRMYDG